MYQSAFLRREQECRMGIKSNQYVNKTREGLKHTRMLECHERRLLPTSQILAGFPFIIKTLFFYYKVLSI